MLDGHSYNDVIGGLPDPMPVGGTLQGIADPKAPNTLSSAAAVAHAHSPWKAFIAPAVPLLLLVCSVALIAWRYRRGPHSATSP